MALEKTVNGKKIRVETTDITDIEVGAFVFYAQENLQLGTGFGGAIAGRGGVGIQEDLDKIGNKKTTEVAVTSAGEMKAKFILHAVGPKFQEEDFEGKLVTTIINSLKAAEDKDVTSVALPAMGAGFYGLPVEDSAKITVAEVAKYLKGNTKLTEVVFCMLDSKQYKNYEQHVNSVG